MLNNDLLSSYIVVFSINFKFSFKNIINFNITEHITKLL